ncbi:hypothetical protein C7R43_14240 [Staphylococcus aureus]|nr:hypothetical protein C7R43_14240 [Staphylococcus aureus]
MYEQCIQKIGETNINIIVRNIMHKIVLYNLKNIYRAPIDKFKRIMKTVHSKHLRAHETL